MSQLFAVTGKRKPRYGEQVAEVNARLPYLASTMAQKSQEEFQTAQINDMSAKQKLEEGRFGLEKSRFNLAEGEYGLNQKRLGLETERVAQQEQQDMWQRKVYDKSSELQQDTEQKQMGIKAAGLGMSLFGSKMSGAGNTLGDLGNKVGSLWNGLFPSSPAPTFGTTGIVSGMNIGATLGGGAIGFGVGKAFGGKNKLKSGAIGAGVGGIASYLGGNQNFGDAIGGAMLGGLGGLF